MCEHLQILALGKCPGTGVLRIPRDNCIIFPSNRTEAALEVMALCLSEGQVGPTNLTPSPEEIPYGHLVLVRFQFGRVQHRTNFLGQISSQEREKAGELIMASLSQVDQSSKALPP